MYLSNLSDSQGVIGNILSTKLKDRRFINRSFNIRKGLSIGGLKDVSVQGQ